MPQRMNPNFPNPQKLPSHKPQPTLKTLPIKHPIPVRLKPLPKQNLPKPIPPNPPNLPTHFIFIALNIDAGDQLA